MSWPKASDDLHKYIDWRKSLTPLPVGTIVKWVDAVKYSGSSMSSDIKPGACFMLGETRLGITASDKLLASHVYKSVLCTSKGKLFKRTEYYFVESIAKWLAEGKMEIVFSPETKDTE